MEMTIPYMRACMYVDLNSLVYCRVCAPLLLQVATFMKCPKRMLCSICYVCVRSSSRGLVEWLILIALRKNLPSNESLSQVRYVDPCRTIKYLVEFIAIHTLKDTLQKIRFIFTLRCFHESIDTIDIVHFVEMDIKQILG
jgi:hypothetical protein